MAEDDASTASEPSRRVVVTYTNLPAAKPVYVAGVQGHVTAHGTLQMGFYSEYVDPVPLISSDEDAASRYAGDLGRKSVDSNLRYRPPREADVMIDDDLIMRIVRPLEVSVVMSKDTARGILAWLGASLEDEAKEDEDGNEESA